MDTSIFVPKFAREELQPIEVLADYENAIQQACAADKSLAQWARDPTGPNKRFVKQRADEYLPALRFARLHRPDLNTHFRLPPEGDAVDIQIGSPGGLKNYQITIANADWANDGSNAGKHHHLMKRLLNQDGVVYGNGPFTKKDGKIVNTGRMMRSADEGDQACRRAITTALDRKASADGTNSALLIYLAESGLSFHSPLDEIVGAAAKECKKLPTFHPIFVYNHDSLSLMNHERRDSEPRNAS